MLEKIYNLRICAGFEPQLDGFPKEIPIQLVEDCLKVYKLEKFHLLFFFKMFCTSLFVNTPVAVE